MSNLTTKVFEALGSASMCWSETPKGIFDSTKAAEIGDALMEIILGERTFSWALQQLTDGKAVQRSGWNGKGMFLYHVPGNTYRAETEIARSYFGENVPYGPYIAMKTAQGNVVPWLASQTDLLAQDWEIFTVQVPENIVAGEGLETPPAETK